MPAVLALAFLLLFAWVVVDEPFRDSFYRANFEDMMGMVPEGATQ